MLLKAYRTRDLHSYSSLNMLLVNMGNLIYWLYILQLPFGPIWLLHAFYTVSSALLLVLYLQLYVNPCLRWYVCKFRQNGSKRRWGWEKKSCRLPITKKPGTDQRLRV